MFKKIKSQLKNNSGSSSGSQGQYAPPPGPPPTKGSYGAQPSYGSSYNAPQQYYNAPAVPPPTQAYAPPTQAVPGISESQMAALRRYDTVVLLDDSGSMEMYWDETRDALYALVQEAIKWDADGIDLYFFNDNTVARNVTSKEQVAQIFRRVDPRRSTPTASALRRITEPYIQALEASKVNGTAKPKPINILCLTDGAPNRGEEPEALIVDLAKRLDAGRFPLTQLGIQFIQIGDDAEAREALQHLDDNIVALSGENKIRDIVDTTLYEGKIDGPYLLKALLGAINKKIDSQN